MDDGYEEFISKSMAKKWKTPRFWKLGHMTQKDPKGLKGIIREGVGTSLPL